jgi:NADPH:quinone reductase-like Zn-dependent oxidoreductase
MKTNLQLLIGTSCLALSFMANALAQPSSPNPAPLMKAVIYHEFGPPEVLTVQDVPKPVPTDNQVLIKVRAASLNPYDWHFMTGMPYIMRTAAGFLKPTDPRLGVDFSGTVEAVGKNVTKFKPGDDVIGAKGGAFAEYVCGSEKGLIIKPANLNFEEGASVPIAGLTAFLAVRDKGNVQPGQKVLINGASGGVGTFAVQIAKVAGAEVTGVCSTRNVEMVRSLGADHVIDYTKEDFTKRPERYDLILDNVGNRSLSDCRGALTPNGKYIMIGGPNGTWIRPMDRALKAAFLSRFVSQKLTMMLSEPTPEHWAAMQELLESGKVKPVIDRRYPLSQIAEAMRYLEQGHARGKVIVTMEPGAEAGPAHPKVASAALRPDAPGLVLFEFIAFLFSMLIVPIIIALALNRRFKRRNPEKRSYRWGYYFSIMSFIAVLGLSYLLFESVTAVIGFALLYAVLAWFFAQRHHWAWIALTILSFNPIAWIINAIYLWKRWAEEPVDTVIGSGVKGAIL